MAPSFLGFFSKRDNPKALRKSSEPSLHSRPKSPAGLPHAPSSKSSLPSPSIADTSEQQDESELSIEAEYVLADADSPTFTTGCVYPPTSSSSIPSNVAGPSTSTTKLKMPFRRKQSTPGKLSTTVTPQILVSPVLLAHEPHKFSMESSVSSLLPPPSRSTIFGSYADPHNALSTRSLPQDVPLIHSRNPSQDYETMSNPDSHTTSLPAPPSKQPSKGGLFSWARPRGRTKSKASLPDPSLRSPPVLTLPPTDSFDLKSFRYVTSPDASPPSPDTPPNKSPQPRSPRPRGDSFTSNPSQRISIAAFREAQARRSITDSPVPSSSGDRDSFASSQVRINKPSSLLATPPSGPASRLQPRFPSSRSPPSRSSTAPVSFSMSMTSSESSEEEGSESEEEEATLRLTRKRTITSRSVHSELGHRSSPISTFSATRSDIGHGLSSGLTSRPPAMPQNARNSPGLEASGSGSRSPSVYSNARGSVSTSALMPDSTANRVSGILKSPAVSKPMQPSPRSRSRASTSSESSSESSDSDDAPLSSLLPPQRPGSAMSRASGSPARHPAKPLIDIGQLVGESSALPPRPSEPSSDPSQPVAQADSPTVRLRKTSLGLGERLSALASGLGGLQPSRSKSQDSLESKDETFTPPEIPEKPPTSPSPVTSPLISPLPSPVLHPKPSSPALKPKSRKPSSALRFQSSGTPKLNTSSLDLDSTIPPPSSSSTSSDAPIPHIKPTPIRAREEPPAFTVTSRPISHASNPSIGTLTAVDKAVVVADYKSEPRRSVPSSASQPKLEQRQQWRPPQEELHTTVRVVRSVPLKSVKEEPLPALRPQSRPRLPSVAVTVSNVHLTPPSSSVSSSSSALRRAPGSGGVVPPRRPFAMRDSSPASSAGDSSSSRMPITPRDGSDLGVGPTGRPGLGHRKRASVTFADELEDERGGRERERERKISVGSRLGHGHGPAAVAGSSDDEDSDREREAEKKRRERRRGEAKAAIELGNVINGAGPIDDDDDEDEEQQPINVPPRMSMAMGGGVGMNHAHDVPFPSALPHMGLQGQWGASAAAPFGNQLGSLSMQNLLNAGVGPRLPGGMDAAVGMNMGAGMFDPRVIAVHQQAMMIAKQTYQLAVAQQAMRDAAEEWERGSAISGWTGGGGRSSVATPSMLGMGMGMGMGMNMPMNMNMGGGGSGGNGMGGYPGLGGSYLMPNTGGMWPGGAMPGFPGNTPRSMHYAASEYGGPSSDRGGPGGWATSSVYGEAFGAPRDRSSRAFRQSQVMQASGGSGGSGGSAPTPAQSNLKRDREGARPRTRTAPSGLNPAAPRASSAGVKKKGEGYGLVGTVSPPSSWKGSQ